VTPYEVEPTHRRAWSEGQLDALFAEGFPPFITADMAVKPWIGRVREFFAHLDIVLNDDGQPVATGWGVPIAWDGRLEDLPESFAEILRRAVALHEAGAAADTFVICGGVVHPARKGTGVASALVEALRDTGTRSGLVRVLAPVRPTRKHLYPLASIASYAAWVREDGLPLDPWLRLHVRLGGRVIATAPAAQTMSGTVAQWEHWTGLALPESGTYVISQGMDVLRVDRGADEGVYVEPNIWVQHR
jgi:GNAT superfamily N-acetyltransferase